MAHRSVRKTLLVPKAGKTYLAFKKRYTHFKETEKELQQKLLKANLHSNKWDWGEISSLISNTENEASTF